jgi:penicillin-binding protein 1A
VRTTYVRFAVVVLLAGIGLAVTALALVPAGRQLASAMTSSANGSLDLGPLDQRSYVYDMEGRLVASFRAEIDRQPVPLDRVPSHVTWAVLAVEDADFFTHQGVNLRAMFRALLRNVDEGGIAQGGSTITQQLVKQELVGDAQSVERKAREAVLASRLENEMTKPQILERYLNTVYFGHGAYGVQAASETFFGVGVEQIDAGQAALLAGIIANPSLFDPVRQPEAAERRRTVALSRMVEVGVISAEEAAWHRSTPLPTEVNQVLPNPDDYFAEEVKRILLDDPRLGPTRDERAYKIFRGGLRIHTTLDNRAQLLAVAARDGVLGELAPEGTKPGTVPLSPNPMTGEDRYATGAVVSVEPRTGAVRSMVGGPGFDLYQYNIVTQARRQTGSAFKTFVLMALLENGYVPSDSVSGSGPCTFQLPPPQEPYRVENFGNSRGGTADITTQTTRSSNCAYVRLGQIVGLDKVVEQTQRMGVTSPLDPEIFSLPLGTLEITPLEAAAAYATIANDGIYNPPYLIERVEDRQGRVIFEHQPSPRRASSPQSARLAARVLEQNVRSGTGGRARIPNQHAAGKTGTAQGSGDAWFVGFTPHLATAVWMGSPHDRFDMRIRGTGVTGGSYPAEIWGRYMRPWHEGLETIGYPDPERTRSGRFLSVDRSIDPRAGSSNDTTTRRRSTNRASSGSGSSGSGGSTTGGGGGGTTGSTDAGGGTDPGSDTGGDGGGTTGGGTTDGGTTDGGTTDGGTTDGGSTDSGGTTGGGGGTSGGGGGTSGGDGGGGGGGGPPTTSAPGE